MREIEAIITRGKHLTGHVFKDKLLCAEATQMAAPKTAVIYDGRYLGLDNNKRLSILGDAVLAKVLCAAWFNGLDANGRTHFRDMKQNLMIRRPFSLCSRMDRPSK